MNRYVTKDETLPSFQLDLDELQLLVEKLREHVSEDNQTLDVRLWNDGVVHAFENASEISSSADLPATVSMFRIIIDAEEGRLEVDCWARYRCGNLEVQSTNGVWSAGVADIVLSFLKSKKTWYASLWSERVHLTLASIVIVVGVILFGSKMLSGQSIDLDPEGSLFVNVMMGGFVLFVLWVLRAKFFPASKIIVRRKKGFFENHNASIAGITTILLALYGAVDLIMKIISALSKS